MIKLILAFVFIASINAGVGDIAGGGEKYQKGSHIHFQRNSTWVNVLYSKTLCQTAYNYEALLRECAKWKIEYDGRTCVEYRKVPATQPKESRRKRCDKFEDNVCVKWIEVDFIQRPNRIVEIKDEDGNVKKRVKVVVPACN